MVNIGDRFISGNIEDIMSLRKCIISDIFEVAEDETYYELEEYVIIRGTNK